MDLFAQAPCSPQRNALSPLHGSRYAMGENAREAGKTGAHGTHRSRAVFCIVGDGPRPRREFYGFPQTDFGKLWLGPRPGGLGLFADLACGGTDGAAGWPAVRPLGSTHRLFARDVSARCGVPDRGACATSLAIPAEHRAV